ncbi:MAG: class II fumarate hydratase [Candidatus Puniceispirillum sp.]|nr:class II fumarate hydratase [Candidatus Pelagibacter sp.]MBA4283188.1 class II fumarate hydratase [Candidatus Puniceispirillum sp.]
MDKQNIRLEHDTMGDIEVDSQFFWGAQTERSRRNFRIGEERMPMGLIHAFVHLKWSAAHVNCELGCIDAQRSEAIKHACDEILKNGYHEHFPLVVWQTGSGTQTNMNVNEVIAFLANRYLKQNGFIDILVHPNDHVNCSQSSNDSFPTAMHIATVLDLHQRLLPAAEYMYKSLRDKAIAYKDVLKIARTHLQDATPMTLGQEFSGYATQIRFCIERINNVFQRLGYIAQGGTAVGTGLNCPEGFSQKIAEVLSQRLKFEFKPAPNFFEALASHDTMVECSGYLNVFAVALMKIANDTRLLGSGPRCGLGEIILPANEPGSSIMPGKVNPTQAEAMTMVCAQVMGNHTTITVSGSQGHLELNVFKPVIIHNLLQSIRLLSDAMNSFTENCLDGLKPDEARLSMNVENSLMLVTILNPIIGYENAAKIAKYSYEHNVTLRKAAEQLEILSVEEFDKIVDAKRMAGSFPENI